MMGFFCRRLSCPFLSSPLSLPACDRYSCLCSCVSYNSRGFCLGKLWAMFVDVGVLIDTASKSCLSSCESTRCQPSFHQFRSAAPITTIHYKPATHQKKKKNPKNSYTTLSSSHPPARILPVTQTCLRDRRATRQSHY